MRITCPFCGGRAAISSRNKLAETVADLYCACRDPKNCGATFVLTLAFKHTLNPPVRSTMDLAQAVINGAVSGRR